MDKAKVFWGIDLRPTVGWIAVIDLVISFPTSLLWIHSMLMQLYLLMHTKIDYSASKEAVSNQKTVLKIEIFLTLVFLTGHVAWICFEFYLFKLLRNGASKRNFTCCYKWFNFRVVLLMVGTYLTVIDIIFRNYNLADIVYEVETVYRVLVMVCVKCFMNQMEEFAKKLTSVVSIGLQDMRVV